MGEGRSLRRRLTITYTVALAIGLLVFAAVSLATIDHNLKTTLDARLATTARALAATTASHARVSKVDPQILHRLAHELGIQQNGAIVGRDGSIAMASAVVPAAIVGFARAEAGDAPAYATVPGDGGLRVVAMRAPGVPAATIVVWRPIDVIVDYERIALATLATASLVIIAVAFVAGSLIVERGLRPLRVMTAVASEIEAHDLTRRLDDRDWDDELRTFARTFDRMLERVESAFGRQRQFTADASHDLRAPLSVMRAEADLALARPRAADDDRASFESIRDEVLELERLLEALLLSARADAEPIEATAVDLVDLAARATARLDPFAAARSVRIANDIAASPPIVGNGEILERVVVSLLHNGIKFSPEGGAVSLRIHESGDFVSLVVRDEGPGFSDEGLERACDRFWKADTARGRSGTGLGLAIAKSAVERLGGSITIRNAREGGAEVETAFPRAFS